MKWSAKSNILGGVAALCILGFVAYTSLHDISFHQRSFDSSAWQSGDVRCRGEMVRSLRVQSLLRDKTQDQIVALLGKADEDLKGQLRYRVDMGRRIVWRPFLMALVVSFDDKGRVYQAEMVD